MYKHAFQLFNICKVAEIIPCKVTAETNLLQVAQLNPLNPPKFSMSYITWKS